MPPCPRWAETDDSDTLLRYYVHGPTYIDERVLMHDAGSISDYFYLLQELYTVAGLADAEGNMVESYDYDGFGTVEVYSALPISCDSDADGDCDLMDFGEFQVCFDVTPVCEWADVDTDDDVDLDDYEVLWSCPSPPPAVLCGDSDYDGDGFVDGDDQEAFGSCYTGPGVPISPEDEERCGMFDLDCDGDIDSGDFGIHVDLMLHPVGDTVYVCLEQLADDTSPLGNPYYFTGRRLDVIPVPGDPRQIYYYRRRNYDPFHARFMQRDPLGYVDGMNLYEYVRSRPTVLVDPNGLYGRETHMVLTQRIAESGPVGFEPDYARMIGEMNIGVDGLVGPSGWLVWGLDWHFDIDTEGGAVASTWGAGDSRFRHAEEQMERAVRLCANEPGGEEDSVRDLGRGLHPIQDFYAHGNWRVWFFPSPIPLFHPEWYDDPGFDGHGPDGIPIQDPDDVWTNEDDAIRGTRRYTRMRRHSEEYLQRFIREVRASNGPHARCCLNELLRNP